MIQKIIAWSNKNERNSILFLFYNILLIMLILEGPLFVFLFKTYGLFGRFSIKYVFLFLSLIFISIFMGAQIAIKLRFNKKD